MPVYLRYDFQPRKAIAFFFSFPSFSSSSPLAPYFFRVLLARSVTSARVAMLSLSSRPPERYLYSFLFLLPTFGDPS